MSDTRDVLAELAAATPFIPEMHTDDCEDTTCVRCRVLTPANLYAVDTWLDNADVFTKQYRENVAGELVITGLRIGQRPDHVVAKFGNTIVRHTNGRHTVRPTEYPTGELTAAEWNERYPVGTPVMAYPGIRPDDPVAVAYQKRVAEGRTYGGTDPCERLETKTRTKASTYGGHTPVVWVEGHGAWIALTHIDVIEGGVR